MPREIAPLKCTACAVEFFASEGGMCGSCRRPFCGFDLFIRDNDATPHCQACSDDVKGSRRLLEKARNISLWSRWQLILSQQRRGKR
jgi:predicted sulfurtransferase